MLTFFEEVLIAWVVVGLIGAIGISGSMLIVTENHATSAMLQWIFRLSWIFIVGGGLLSPFLLPHHQNIELWILILLMIAGPVILVAAEAVVTLFWGIMLDDETAW